MTDSEYVLDQLRAHPKGRDAMQIISSAIRDRDVGLTVHSRVADLRAQGYEITCGVEGQTRKGRPRWVYRLVSEPPRVIPVAPLAPVTAAQLERDDMRHPYPCGCATCATPEQLELIA